MRRAREQTGGPHYLEDGSSRRGLEETGETLVSFVEVDDRIGPWNFVELDPWPPGTVPPPDEICYDVAQGPALEAVLLATRPEYLEVSPGLPRVGPLAANGERSLLDFADAYTTELHCGWHIQCDVPTDVVVLELTSFHMRFLDYFDLHSGEDGAAPWIASLDEDDVAENPTFMSSRDSMYIAVRKHYEHGANIFETHGFQAEYWCESRDLFVWGCTNHEASNYDPVATADDGSCASRLGDALLSAMVPSPSSRALFQEHGWISGNDPCRDEWKGVTCDAHGRITQISFLAPHHLFWHRGSPWHRHGSRASPGTAKSAFPFSTTGQLKFELGADSLGDLTDLRSFNTGWVQYPASGTIPHTIGNLVRLKELFLIARLSGTVPPEIVRCTNLAVFVSHYSRISGSLPDIFAGGRLEQFANFRGKISGTLPSSFGESRHMW
eukprot:COSAG03_NODE_557_length_6952_cov_2.339559_8_plen_439_part_00